MTHDNHKTVQVCLQVRVEIQDENQIPGGETARVCAHGEELQEIALYMGVDWEDNAAVLRV